jgi:glycosyltransferase involved in cell wall biosynthesis
LKVSVIIPFTEREIPVLQNAIDSVKAQTYQDFEIVQIFDRQRHGIGWARNQGLHQSTGYYLLPLDADDTIEPTFLEETTAKMGEAVGIVSTAMRYVGDKNLVIRDGARTLHDQLGGNGIPCCSLIRKDAVEDAGGWFEGINGWEDWDLWLEILNQGWTHEYVDEPLFNYTFSETGMNAFADKRKKQYLEIMRQRHKGFRA